MRSYTVREQRRTPEGADEVDIDFVLHGDPAAAAADVTAPASYWAGRAVTGRRIMAIGPAVAENKSVRFQPPRRPTRCSCTRTRRRSPRPPRSWTGSPPGPGSPRGSRSRTPTTGSSCRRSPTRTSPGSCGRAARARSAPSACWRHSGRPNCRSPKLRTPGSRARPATIRAVRRRCRTGTFHRPACGAFHRLLAARRERGGTPRRGVRGPGGQRGTHVRVVATPALPNPLQRWAPASGRGPSLFGRKIRLG